MADPAHLPHSTEAERALLGALITRNDLIGDVADMVEPSSFYTPANQHVYAAIVALHEANIVADVVTIPEYLRRQGLDNVIEDSSELLRLVQECPAPSSAVNYAQIVAENASLRDIIAASSDIRDLGLGSTPVESAVEQARERLDRLHIATRSADVPLGDAIDSVLERSRRAAVGETPTGNRTGLPDLDRLLGGGLKAGTLNIIAGRPGSGKSALAAQVAGHQAIHEGLAVYFVSLEMTADEVTSRLLAGEAGIEERRIAQGTLSDSEWDVIAQTSQKIKDAKIRYLDPTAATLSAIRNGARQARTDWGRLDLVVIDYIQLMTSSGPARDRQLEVAAFSRGLKIMARELEIPVLALSQLSRALEARVDKRPMLSDLRESGSLEQDADTVWATYRDAMYDPTADPTEAEIIVLKQRSGPTGTVCVCWDAPVYRFLPGAPRTQEAQRRSAASGGLGSAAPAVAPPAMSGSSASRAVQGSFGASPDEF